MAAAASSEIDIRTICEQLPEHLTIWIDPCEVSYRLGERGEITSLWQEKHQHHLQLRPKEHKTNRKQQKNKNSKGGHRGSHPGKHSSNMSESSSSAPSSRVSISPLVSSPPHGSPGSTPRHSSGCQSPLLRDDTMTSSRRISMSAPASQTTQESSWSILGAMPLEQPGLFDQDRPWSSSTWETCSAGSDDSGFGSDVSLVSSPVVSPDQSLDLSDHVLYFSRQDSRKSSNFGSMLLQHAEHGSSFYNHPYSR